MSSFLNQILIAKKAELAAAKGRFSIQDLQRRIRGTAKPLSFRRALASVDFGIIAEIKKKSPSMGAMLPQNVDEAPEAYHDSEIVRAVSVLTNRSHFGMGIEDLEMIKRRVAKPILRKDFIFDEYQIYEARAFGADAILLMASILSKKRLKALFELASEIGLDVLFECHTEREIDLIPFKAKIYGINSRKFKSEQSLSGRYAVSRLISKLFGTKKDLSTDISLFEKLVHYLPTGVIKVAESGVKPSQIAVIKNMGFDCALIGTAFLKSPSGVRDVLSRFEGALRNPSETAGVPDLAGIAG